MNEIARSTIRATKLAAKFNEQFPIGTAVRYWAGIRKGMGKISKTRSEATVLGGHTAVVWLEDQVGCIALSHIEPLP